MLIRLFTVLDYIIEKGELENDLGLLLDMLDFLAPPKEMQKKVAAYLDELKPQFEGTI